MISITILRTYNFHINLYDLALMVMVLCMIHILGIDICLDTYFPRCRKPNVIKLRKAL